MVRIDEHETTYAAMVDVLVFRGCLFLSAKWPDLVDR